MKPARKDAEVIRELRRVLALEAKTLAGLGRAVDARYAAAVRLLAKCRGKVLVTGVGKSGLIAQKVAATLSSTGTPAVHLDPTEALHGGLGLVQKGDVLIAIGKSGESEELNALLPRLRAIGVNIVAVTANPSSTLTRAAELVLLTPVEAEACPHNLAPTSSTTAALAVGDALAVALMKVRGFGREHFALNHPGGRLGRRLTLKVSDIMRGGEDNPVVRSGVSAMEMLMEMTRKRAGAVSVVDARGRLVGLITDFDIRRGLEKGLDIRKLPISSIMNTRPTTISPSALAAKAVEIMENRKNPFNVLPVVDARGRSVGMIQIHDLRARGL
ncbi:MAG TPA: KpsF/GutQ family sugar-phosphate isomerase [Elusimicrobiota bacterium]|nr:KpsF/GutQ family sugar-phosphate isomerase [Elusimicrobiota bacterium]